MTKKNKIAVIMPSYLGEYEGCSSNREGKLLRAVNSFLMQRYYESRLYIVSDGCEITNRIYDERFKKFSDRVVLVKLPKQELFSGNVRQAGIDYANKTFKPNIIVPLDSDDMFTEFHLMSVNKEIKDNDFIYSDELYLVKPSELRLRGIQYPKTLNDNPVFAKHHVELKPNMAGTSSIVWRNKPEFTWKGCDGWGHDWKFISERLKANSDKYERATLGYVICHIQKWFDN